MRSLPLRLFTETTYHPLSRVAASHCEAIKLSSITDLYTANKLVHSYNKCNQMCDALKLFGEMPHRDTASWNTIISGYVNSGNFFNAWEIFKSMKRLEFLTNAYTYGSTLKGIAAGGVLICGQQVHSDIVKVGFGDDVYSASALLDMYAKYCRVDDANKVFKHMKERNSVSWNALIGAYVEVGSLQRCIELFICMEMESVRVDAATFSPLLTLLCHNESYELLRQLHGKIMKRCLEKENTVLNATITAYAGCGFIEDSKRVFDDSDGFRDIVTWNSMLAAYLENDLEEYGFNIFLEMMQLRTGMDAYSYSSILSSCVDDAQLNLGKSLHGLLIKRGFEHVTPTSNALMNMYLKSSSQCMENAFKVFKHIGVKDRVSWNTILTGLSQNGLSEDALRLFRQMHLDYPVIDQYAFAAVLRSCSDLATLQLGRQIHVLVVKSGLDRNEYVASALIFVYSRCGIVEDAWKSFETSHKESSVTWNSIIFAYAQHGQGKIALELFNLMTVRHVNLDHITFVAVITACSHIGLVDKGLSFLKSMETQYGIPPRMENYACTIDLLGRAGRVKEAKQLITEMPFEPDVMVWKTLLGSCRACGDLESATQIADHLVELDPGDHCTYVLLSDMYGHVKRWDEKANVKRLMRDTGVKKVPGWSWIELQNEIHAFNADDHSHPSCREIYQVLGDLIREIRVSEHFCLLEMFLNGMDIAHGYWFLGSDGVIQNANRPWSSSSKMLTEFECNESSLLVS